MDHQTYERTLMNILIAIFLGKGRGAKVHLDELTDIVNRIPRFKEQGFPEANVRSLLQYYVKKGVFIKPHKKRDGIWMLNDSYF